MITGNALLPVAKMPVYQGVFQMQGMNCGGLGRNVTPGLPKLVK